VSGSRPVTRVAMWLPPCSVAMLQTLSHDVHIAIGT
jgi:hypothetical protein